MKVSEIMSSPPVTVSPQTSFKAALGLMLERGVSGLPVVQGDDQLVGIVTEADFVSKEAYGGTRRRALDVILDILGGGQSYWARKAEGLTVDEVMTHTPITASPDEDIRAAARRMVGVKRLPVVDSEGRVVGVVSRHDVLELFRRPDAELRHDLVARYSNPAWSPETARFEVAVVDGVVTLTGSVAHPMDLVVMDSVAWSIPGVVGVHNKLAAREPDPRID